MFIAKIDELTIATAEHQAATEEALQLGLIATRPLSSQRIMDLCELGERMVVTALRKARAEAAVAELNSVSRPTMSNTAFYPASPENF